MDPVRNSFGLDDYGKHRCLHCREHVSNRPCRMKAHLSKCQKKKDLTQVNNDIYIDRFLRTHHNIYNMIKCLLMDKPKAYKKSHEDDCIFVNKRRKIIINVKY